MPRTTDLGFLSSATNQSGFIITDAGRTVRIRYQDLVFWLSVELGLTQILSNSADVNFNSVQTANTGTFDRVLARKNISIGASNPLNVLDRSLFISNDATGNPRPTNIEIKGFQGNYGTNLPIAPQILQTLARGTPLAPNPVVQGDSLGVLAFAGHDSQRFTNTSTGRIVFRAGENWDATANDTTKAGTSFTIASQPISTILSPDSSFSHIWQEWSLSGDNVAINNLYIGDGSMNSSVVLRRSSGAVQTGHGASNINFVNSQLKIIGVPSESTVDVDNPSLDNTVLLSFVAGRKSGTLGRRDAVKNNDTVGIIDFRGQNTNSSTNLGVAVGSISMKAIGDFNTTNYGTKLVVNTINSGSNVLSTRLDLTSRFHNYQSDTHVFRENNGSILAALSRTAGMIFYTTATFAAGISTVPTLASREIKSTSTISTASGNTATINLVGFKSYVISKVQTNYPARIRFYTGNVGRNLDFYRNTATSADSDSGVILDIVTTASNVPKVIAPGIFGFNNDSPSSTTMYLSITNNDVVPRSIQVDVTLLQLEQ